MCGECTFLDSGQTKGIILDWIKWGGSWGPRGDASEGKCPLTHHLPELGQDPQALGKVRDSCETLPLGDHSQLGRTGHR